MELKIAFLITLISVTNVLAHPTYSQVAKVSLDMENKSLEQIMDKIQSQSEFYFVFNQKQIDVNRVVSIQADNELVTDILPELFKGTNVNYIVFDRKILLTTDPLENSLLAISSGTEPQQKQITGTVTDKNGAAIPGANVVVTGTTQGTVTDANGKYSIGVFPGSKSLTFKFVGMETQEISIGTLTQINATLVESSIGLEEVIVIGYGTIKKRDLTSSITQVKGELLLNKSNANPVALLAGHASGVQILSNTGTPGDQVTVSIRGNTSLNAGNSPLYVIDGVPSGDITTINSNDIESIEVLKDASASAIYGARASNGVIIITTKRGKSGKPVYEFNSYIGLQQVTKTIPYLNAEEQYQMTLKAIINYDRNNVIPSVIRAQTVADYNAGYNTNWQDEIFRTAPVNNYDFNVLQGNDDLKMAFGLNYYNQDGIIINTNYTRYSSRFNFDLKASKKVRIGATFRFAYEVRHRVQDGLNNWSSVMGNVMRKLPYEPVYEPDGSYSIRERANPVGEAMARHMVNYTGKVVGSAYLEYDIIDHLTFKTLESVDYGDLISENFFPSTLEGVTSRAASFGGEKYSTLLTENTLKYSNIFNENHSLIALLGYSLQEDKDYTYGGAGQNGSSDIIYTLNASALKTDAESYKTAWGISSLFGRVNYSFKDKYLLTVNLRQDGSSRFGGNKKYAIFPALSVGWRLYEEPFFKNVPYVSDLKLRGSVGRTGNQNISNYAAQGLYGVGASYSGNPGVYSTNLANGNLTWETTDQYDLGMDLSFFKNRVSIILDTYLKNTSNLLFNEPVPLTTGYSSSWQNLGKIQNKGLEISINTNIIKGKGFSWSSDFNISFNRNKVIELPSHTPIISTYFQNSFTDASYFLTQEGQPMGLFYGVKWTGKVYPTNEEAIADITMVNGRPNLGGNYQYVDISGPAGVPDKIISYQYDRTVIGNPWPKFIGGWTNRFNYKGFDLSCTMAFEYGNSIYNENERMAERFCYNGYSKVMLNAWTEPGQITTVHKVYPATNDEVFQTKWIEDGSYLKVKDITFGYSLPTTVLSKIKLSNLRVYLSTYNLLTFTHYKGFDPDVNAQYTDVLTTGCDSGVFPQMRSVLIGINFKF